MPRTRPRAKNAAETMTRPDGLTPQQVAEWKWVVAAKEDAGQPLRRADRSALALYIDLWEVNRLLYLKVQEFGAVIKYANGMVGPSPWFNAWTTSGLRLDKMQNALGLTPKARDFDRKPATAAEPPPLEVD